MHVDILLYIRDGQNFSFDYFLNSTTVNVYMYLSHCGIDDKEITLHSCSLAYIIVLFEAIFFCVLYLLLFYSLLRCLSWFSFMLYMTSFWLFIQYRFEFWNGGYNGFRRNVAARRDCPSKRGSSFPSNSLYSQNRENLQRLHKLVQQEKEGTFSCC